MVEIFYSPKFLKMYRKLPRRVKLSAHQKENIFRQNPYDPGLKTHKLTGKLKKYWAFSIGYNYRIVFSFTSDQNVRFHAVGTHAIYNRLMGIS